MAARIDLTLDCANPARLAAFCRCGGWRTGSAWSEIQGAGLLRPRPASLARMMA
jgi:hypothetical protein